MSELLGMPIGFWITEVAALLLLLFRHRIVRFVVYVMLIVFVYIYFRKLSE